MSDIEKYSDATFESIKHTNADGQEYWLARELQAVLEYTQWRRFSEVIERAKESCKNSGYSVEDHFANVGKMVAIGSGAERKVDDLMLSRYACYLIVQNGDPRKEVIAVGQTYFAVKTRQQELIENYDILSEEQNALRSAPRWSSITSHWPKPPNRPGSKRRRSTPCSKTKGIRAYMAAWECATFTPARG